MSSNPSEYLKRVNAALALREIPDYPATLSQLLRAVELAPEDASVHLLLGLTYQDLDQLDRAEKSFRRAVAIQPDLQEANQSLGMTLFLQKKYGAAIPILKSIAKSDPDNLKVVKSLATAYTELEKYAEAIDVLQKVFIQHPEELSIIEQLVRVLEKAENLEQAIEITKQTIEISPSASLYNSLGILYKKTGETQKAKQLFETAIQLDESFEKAWSNLAQALADLDEPLQALQVLEEGINRIPESFPLLDRKASILSDSDRWEEGLDLYNQLITRAKLESPELLDWLYFRRVVLSINHFGIDAGLELTHQVLDEYPESHLLYWIIPDYLIKIDRFQDALDLLEKVPLEKKLANVQIGTNYYIGLVAAGQSEASWQFIQAFYRHKNRKKDRTLFIDLVENSGVDLFQNGHAEGSRQIFEHVLRLEPERARSLNNLGFIYISQREWNQALTLLDQVDLTEYNYPAILKANRGYIEINLGLYEKARTTFTDSLELAQENETAILHVAYPWINRLADNFADNFPSRMVNVKASVFANLATCYYFLGDIETALITAQKAIDIDPDESTGVRVQGCIYFLLGKDELAREAWLKALDAKISAAEKEVVQIWLNSSHSMP